MDETLINQTLKNLNSETVSETLLDELQTKVCSIFSSLKSIHLIINLKGFRNSFIG